MKNCKAIFHQLIVALLVCQIVRQMRKLRSSKGRLEVSAVFWSLNAVFFVYSDTFQPSAFAYAMARLAPEDLAKRDVTPNFATA